MLENLKSSNVVKDYIASFMIFFMTACMMCVHYEFAPILCGPCIAIIASVIFTNRKLTRQMLICSFVALVLSYMISSAWMSLGGSKLFANYLIAGVLYIVSYVSAIVLAIYEEERSQAIYKVAKNESEMAKQIKQDSFTGLLNRKEFFDRMAHYVGKKKLSKEALHLAIIDIDDFKKVNDKYGHARGDEVLIYLSTLLKLRGGTVGEAARYGGEEFALILPKISHKEAFELMESIRKEFCAHDFAFMGENHISFSCGLAEYPDKPWTAGEFFDKADEFLYKAKFKGKNMTVDM